MNYLQFLKEDLKKCWFDNLIGLITAFASSFIIYWFCLRSSPFWLFCLSFSIVTVVLYLYMALYNWESPNEKYERLSGGSEPLVLSEEGTKKFFEMLKEPNPQRDKTLKEAKELLTDEEKLKFGKERITVRTKRR